jgi:putative transposase
VDTQGLLLGVVVHAADIQDADGLWPLLKRLKPLYAWLRVVFADSIYNRVSALLACFLLGLTLVVVGRIAGTKGFVVIPRRWVVERTIGWLGRWRRLSKDYEQLPEVSEAIAQRSAGGKHGGAVPGHLGHDPPHAPPSRPPEPQATARSMTSKTGS